MGESSLVPADPAASSAFSSPLSPSLSSSVSFLLRFLEIEGPLIFDVSSVYCDPKVKTKSLQIQMVDLT